MLAKEAEVRIERMVVYENGEEGEDIKEVDLLNAS
jgi:hypothetical protein